MTLISTDFIEFHGMARLDVYMLKNRMMNEVEKLLQAQLLKEEPDKAFVKWPKYKRKRLKVKRKTVITNKRTHPGTREARQILRLHGRDLTICEMCGRTGKMQIHHKA